MTLPMSPGPDDPVEAMAVRPIQAGDDLLRECVGLTVTATSENAKAPLSAFMRPYHSNTPTL